MTFGMALAEHLAMLMFYIAIDYENMNVNQIYEQNINVSAM